MSQQVESSVQRVSHLQARLGETHEKQRQEKEHGLLAKEHQLAGTAWIGDGLLSHLCVCIVYPSGKVFSF